MPEAYSEGAKTAWQIAGRLAIRLGANEIRPCHFLLAICKLLDHQYRDPAGGLLQAEVEILNNIFRESDVDVEKTKNLLTNYLKNTIRHNPPRFETVGRASRSPESKEAFEKALIRSQNGEINVIGLLAAICALCDDEVQKCLGGRAGALLMSAARMDGKLDFNHPHTIFEDISLGPSLVRSSDESDLTVVEEIDAAVRMQPSDDHELSSRLALICELTWESGTKDSLDLMLNKVLTELMRIVPSAGRGAILAFDKSANEWILKAHSAGAISRFSTTSIRKAVDQKRGFLWRREGDLSQSQVESEYVAGIYVPMLVNNEIFGMVCLESKQGLPAFEKIDLQLVIAIAHQLGLSIAHDQLRSELATSVKILERLMANFSPRVRTRLLQRARQGKLKLGGERAVVSILCSDIRGFTRISAKMEPEEVGELLNDYFSSLTESVLRNDGTINSFVGDAILAVFGSPEEDPKHCRKAVAAALEMQELAREVSNRRSARGEVTCDIGIGINCGEVVHGFIGSTECMNYTVIGDTVNFASRYCDGAKAGEILVSPGVHQRVWDYVEAEKTGITTKHEGSLTAYRILRTR